jgi:hypothetical protein
VQNGAHIRYELPVFFKSIKIHLSCPKIQRSLSQRHNIYRNSLTYSDFSNNVVCGLKHGSWKSGEGRQLPHSNNFTTSTYPLKFRIFPISLDLNKMDMTAMNNTNSTDSQVYVCVWLYRKLKEKLAKMINVITTSYDILTVKP